FRGCKLLINKKFARKRGSLAKFLENRASVDPPYNAGMAGAFCPVSFNPTRPPADVHEPHWDNIVSNIGNQYLREGLVFGSDVARDSFIYQYLSTQEPGTSETSRFSSDFINGPVAMNSIYRLPVRAKLARPEAITPAQRDLLESMYRHTGLKPDFFGGSLGGTAAQPTIRTSSALVDGADSMGLLMAMTRVYVNEG